jgi:hypothetical protein
MPVGDLGKINVPAQKSIDDALYEPLETSPIQIPKAGSITMAGPFSNSPPH